MGLQNPFRAFWTMFSTSAYSSYGHLLNSNVAELTSYGRYSLEQGKATSGAALAQALHQVNLVKLRFEELLDEYDLLMSPTMPTVAFPVGQAPQEVDGKRLPPHLGYIPFTFPINMSGQTAASIPCRLLRRHACRAPRHRPDRRRGHRPPSLHRLRASLPLGRR